MTDVENLEKIIRDIFGVRKIIKKKRNTNKCIQPLNIYPLNMFAFNFINRLTRLNEKFKDNKIALNTICERVKNLGEAKDSGWTLQRACGFGLLFAVFRIPWNFLYKSS